jgi:WD40 repeat protein
MIRVFNDNGEVLHSIPSTRTITNASMITDPTGQFLALQVDDSQWNLFDVPAKQVGPLRGGPDCLGPLAKSWVSTTPSPPGDSGVVLYDMQSNRPLVTLGTNSKSSVMRMRYSNNGSLLAWGTMDGSVYLCNISKVRDRLKELGLDWRD